MAAIAPTSDKIYQSSDFNQGYRAILDEAREGSNPRVRDKDGTSVVVVLEQEFSALEMLAEATASYLILEHAVRHQEKAGADLSLAELGAWPWLRVFDRDDLSEFLQEACEALVIAHRERSYEYVRVVLRDWSTTAHALSDPERRGILLGESPDDDFVDAARPAAVPVEA